ncbi:hypothetical protein D3C79_846670 [compost metagenome]
MVQLIIDRLEDRLDLGEVADPARVRVERAGQVQADLERVAMQTAAFVPFRDVGQAVGRFECEFLENFHAVITLCESIMRAVYQHGRYKACRRSCSRPVAVSSSSSSPRRWLSAMALYQ